jgi:hypothetical protein
MYRSLMIKSVYMLLTEECKSAVITWLLTSKYSKIPFELAVFILTMESAYFYSMKGHDLISLTSLLVGAVVVICIAAGRYTWLLFFPFMAISGSVSPAPDLPCFQTALVSRNPHQCFQASGTMRTKFKDRIKDPVQVQKNIAELQTAYASSTTAENDSKENHIGETGHFFFRTFSGNHFCDQRSQKTGSDIGRGFYRGPCGLPWLLPG